MGSGVLLFLFLGGEEIDNISFLGFCKSGRTRRKRSCTAHRLLRRFLCGLVRSLPPACSPRLTKKKSSDLWSLRGPTQSSDRRNGRPRHNRLSLTIQIIQNLDLHTCRYLHRRPFQRTGHRCPRSQGIPLYSHHHGCCLFSRIRRNQIRRVGARRRAYGKPERIRRPARPEHPCCESKGYGHL